MTHSAVPSSAESCTKSRAPFAKLKHMPKPQPTKSSASASNASITWGLLLNTTISGPFTLIIARPRPAKLEIHLVSPPTMSCDLDNLRQITTATSPILAHGSRPSPGPPSSSSLLCCSQSLSVLYSVSWLAPLACWSVSLSSPSGCDFDVTAAEVSRTSLSKSKRKKVFPNMKIWMTAKQ